MPGDEVLYYLNKNGVINGAMLTHVDDLRKVN